ncbi:PREDICTED: prostamide/prostaglandin F synthase-like [Amphimedon queenslandica]|uniref:Uncharacterized protein n=1 Tax=Amphimedon queenslandica TaxID=400682 RepID=A0A1X7VGB8_AMPQE|nr:PREDICTED: prostamide/prostaglandin F synthase-like [Amphimedon queenslandica]|eukprot:XP_003384317.1 PREDICTED: prostamide/prostaglandin F synthase-like [Amphimedon queenslandica]
MLGVEEFIERKFFPDSVDIYVDEKKTCYQCLGFKRFTLLNVFKALVSSVSRKAIMEARRNKIEGNMQGDGLQNGGLIIVGKGSKMLLFHKEEYPGEHVENDVILKTLEVDETTVVSAEKADTMAKMEEEGLNCDKACFGDDPPTAQAKKKMFVAKKKT